jgi:hypothetical protein
MHTFPLVKFLQVKLSGVHSRIARLATLPRVWKSIQEVTTDLHAWFAVKTKAFVREVHFGKTFFWSMIFFRLKILLKSRITFSQRSTEIESEDRWRKQMISCALDTVFT